MLQRSWHLRFGLRRRAVIAGRIPIPRALARHLHHHSGVLRLRSANLMSDSDPLRASVIRPQQESNLIGYGDSLL
jgi:hypothetical protein